MRTTVTLDDELVAQAREYTGIKEMSALLREALTYVVQREASRRLAAMGGSMPEMKARPRGRYWSKDGRWISTSDAVDKARDDEE
jgi:Arc/MetJ family transcription regulator